jgi:hypothetical protein
MLKKIKTWMQGTKEGKAVDVELEISEVGEVTKKDFFEVLKFASLTGLAALITALASSLTEVEVADKTILVFVPLITAGLHALSRWITTNISVVKVGK